MNTGTELGQYFCTNKQLKNPCPYNKESEGETEVKWA